MVLQILADARQIDVCTSIPCRRSVVGRADAREHQQLGRIERAGAHDHFAVATHLLGLPHVPILDADAAAAFDQQPRDLGIGLQS